MGLLGLPLPSAEKAIQGRRRGAAVALPAAPRSGAAGRTRAAGRQGERPSSAVRVVSWLSGEWADRGSPPPRDPGRRRRRPGWGRSALCRAAACRCWSGGRGGASPALQVRLCRERAPGPPASLTHKESQHRPQRLDPHPIGGGAANQSLSPSSLTQRNYKVGNAAQLKSPTPPPLPTPPSFFALATPIVTM